MKRADIIGALQRHEAELRKLGVEHLFYLAPLPATAPKMILMSIYFSIIREDGSVCTS
jgi:hypothetical protein